eukprot:TRINITY_DN6552_c0_g1_i1.p1 TRINITY_DN6552_c0_g1~~TRINITY_DN6552_c0_g1_i1.p1  ORF type:complete len:1286 (-),score=279.19 TRINITY_DN6552_c0_g1_i1:569-4327(-)
MATAIDETASWVGEMNTCVQMLQTFEREVLYILLQSVAAVATSSLRSSAKLLQLLSQLAICPIVPSLADDIEAALQAEDIESVQKCIQTARHELVARKVVHERLTWDTSDALQSIYSNLWQLLRKFASNASFADSASRAVLLKDVFAASQAWLSVVSDDAWVDLSSQTYKDAVDKLGQIRDIFLRLQVTKRFTQLMGFLNGPDIQKTLSMVPELVSEQPFVGAIFQKALRQRVCDDSQQRQGLIAGLFKTQAGASGLWHSMSLLEWCSLRYQCEMLLPNALLENDMPDERLHVNVLKSLTQLQRQRIAYRTGLPVLNEVLEAFRDWHRRLSRPQDAASPAERVQLLQMLKAKFDAWAGSPETLGALQRQRVALFHPMQNIVTEGLSMLSRHPTEQVRVQLVHVELQKAFATLSRDALGDDGVRLCASVLYCSGISWASSTLSFPVQGLQAAQVLSGCMPYHTAILNDGDEGQLAVVVIDRRNIQQSRLVIYVYSMSGLNIALDQVNQLYRELRVDHLFGRCEIVECRVSAAQTQVEDRLLIPCAVLQALSLGEKDSDFPHEIRVGDDMVSSLRGSLGSQIEVLGSQCTVLGGGTSLVDSLNESSDRLAVFAHDVRKSLVFIRDSTEDTFAGLLQERVTHLDSSVAKMQQCERALQRHWTRQERLYRPQTDVGRARLRRAINSNREYPVLSLISSESSDVHVLARVQCVETILSAVTRVHETQAAVREQLTRMLGAELLSYKDLYLTTVLLCRACRAQYQALRSAITENSARLAFNVSVMLQDIQDADQALVERLDGIERVTDPTRYQLASSDVISGFQACFTDMDAAAVPTPMESRSLIEDKVLRNAMELLQTARKQLETVLLEARELPPPRPHSLLGEIIGALTMIQGDVKRTQAAIDADEPGAISDYAKETNLQTLKNAPKIYNLRLQRFKANLQLQMKTDASDPTVTLGEPPKLNLVGSVPPAEVASPSEVAEMSAALVLLRLLKFPRLGFETQTSTLRSQFQQLGWIHMCRELARVEPDPKTLKAKLKGFVGNVSALTGGDRLAEDLVRAPIPSDEVEAREILSALNSSARQLALEERRRYLSSMPNSVISNFAALQAKLVLPPPSAYLYQCYDAFMLYSKHELDLLRELDATPTGSACLLLPELLRPSDIVSLLLPGVPARVLEPFFQLDLATLETRIDLHTPQVSTFRDLLASTEGLRADWPNFDAAGLLTRCFDQSLRAIQFSYQQATHMFHIPAESIELQVCHG